MKLSEKYCRIISLERHGLAFSGIAMNRRPRTARARDESFVYNAYVRVYVRMRLF